MTKNNKNTPPEGVEETEVPVEVTEKATGRENWGVGGFFQIDPTTGRRVRVNKKD